MKGDSGMVAVNRQKKIVRFVAWLDATVRENGYDPEEAEVAAAEVAQLEGATLAKWNDFVKRMNEDAVVAERARAKTSGTPFVWPKRENVPSEETRLGISNVYRVRARMPLLIAPWKLPEPPPEMCGYCKEKPVAMGCRDACADCDVKILAGYMDPANQAELRKEEREGAR